MSQAGGKPRGSSGRRISVHCGLHAGGPGPEGERHSGAVSPDADRLLEEIQVAERDGAGYVVQIQIGPKTYSGEEVQYALGLSSPCFYFDELQGKIRVTCKGIGHGYGFSQAGASALEKEGLGFEALLDHYFQNVEILKEGI